MLCTRCQQREAKTPPPVTLDKRAKFEAEFGVSLPFPEGLCGPCLAEWFKSPEAKAQLAPLRRAIGARWQKRMEEWKGEVRAGVLKVLEIADAIAGKL